MNKESQSTLERGHGQNKKNLYEIEPNGHDAPSLLLRAVGHGQKVLEIGCASGVQSRAMREQDCRVTGIEIDAEAAEQARAFCERVIVADLETLDFEVVLAEERFDVITFADVLEHLRHPERVLETARRYLRPGGRIIASIPNVVHAGLILEMAKGRFDYRPYGLLDDTHIRFFTLKSITALFHSCGLEIVQLERASRSLERTEFAINRPLAPRELDMLNSIRANNPEYETYQIIVCAHPAAMAVVRKQELTLREEVQDRQLCNTAHVKRIGRLQSELAWMQAHPLRTFLGALWRALAPNTRP